MKRRVTIKDVARAAGVSRQTVSRAINDKGEISPATRNRVMEAVCALDYRPSRVARGLATRRTRTIGLVVPDITNPFFPEIARGVQDVARCEDHSVFLCNTDESPEEELQALHSLAAQPVDGIILFGSRISDEDLAWLDDYPSLSQVAIASERITDAGLVYLEEERFWQLNLFGTGVTDSGLEHLETLTALSELDLRGTEVTDKGVKKLQEALPKCEIKY